VQRVSRYAVASLASLPLAGLVYLLGRVAGDRMVADSQGWEMAFYLSPLVFLAVDGLLLAGTLAGVVGLALGPGASRRALSAAAAAICAGAFAALPWR
jgi:hypothetical protein